MFFLDFLMSCDSRVTSFYNGVVYFLYVDVTSSLFLFAVEYSNVFFIPPHIFLRALHNTYFLIILRGLSYWSGLDDIVST
jgi:hypothetical protein